MLNPNNDRLYYGSILSPPTNYKPCFAIGTTYSLDLDALVGASISLSLSDDIDSDLADNPIYLLEALRSSSDNVAVFCENGQIKLPTHTTPLYILLENMVFQVKTSKFLQNRYASFHPKFWLIKYCDEENNILYRLIVLSRNLTFDRSWDISFTMDGHKTEESTNKNDAIIRFIDYLCSFSTDDIKTSKMREIMDELKFIDFNLHSRTFSDFNFFVNGIGKDYAIQKSHLFENDSLKNLMIVTPFLSKDVISDFNNRKSSDSKALLFTRITSLDKLHSHDCSNFEVYTLKDEIIDGESIVSEDAQEIYKQDIHAKIYVVENGDFIDLYLGSLNASHNALHGNIEFMIKLQAKRNKLNIKQLSDDLFNGEKGGPKNPFELRNVDEISLDEEVENEDLDLIIKYISRLSSKANIISNEDSFDIELTFGEFDEAKFKDMQVLIKPLLSNKTREFSNKMIFEKLDKVSLSEFFVIKINEGLSRVIKIPTFGFPDDRQKKVISSIITDENAFIKYVAFLLGDEFILSMDNNFVGKMGSGKNVQLPELYEKMLKATIYSPEKFKELEFIINALSDDNVIPEGFEELYNTFLGVLD